MNELSAFIQSVYERDTSNLDPFADPEVAKEFLREVAAKLSGGEPQLRLVIGQVAQVADNNGRPDRADALRAVDIT